MDRRIFAAALLTTTSACSGTQMLRFEALGRDGTVAVQREGSLLVDRRPVPATYELEYSRKPGFIVMIVSGGLLVAGGLAVAGYLASSQSGGETISEGTIFVLTGLPLLTTGATLAFTGGAILAAQPSNRYRVRFERDGVRDSFDLKLPIPTPGLRGSKAGWPVRFDGEELRVAPRP